MMDSGRLTPSLCSIDMFRLSSTAKKLFDLFSLAGISLLPAKKVGFSGKMTPKESKFRKTIALRALTHVKPRLLS